MNTIMFRNFVRLSQLSNAARVAPRFTAQSALWALNTTHTNRITTRSYSAAALTPDLVRERLLEILEGYDKVPRDIDIKEETNFSKDLGLDSLDLVEVVMAIEEEFSIGIPDEKADKIRTFKDALELIVNDPNAT